jgi:hypothetical protein
VEAIYLCGEIGDVSLTSFPNTKSHRRFKGGKIVVKLGLMLILMSDLCDIQSQVTTTAWHECHTGFSSKCIASWLSENHVGCLGMIKKKRVEFLLLGITLP